MTKPLISVVVPLYRVEAEMPLCVDSVLAQTYDRLDVILVDDGSPDGCGRLAEDYARRDARVRAIHRENGGLSAARNTGTLAAKGDYITYVDGDDFLHPVCVEMPVRADRALPGRSGCLHDEDFSEKAG